MTTSVPLYKVERASRRFRDSRLALDMAIRAAREDGASLREIARAAGLTPETIRRISKNVD